MAIHNDQSLLTLLKEIRALIDKSIKNKLKLGDYTMPQTMIMYNLAQNGKMKISQLSEKMGLTNSTVSGIVDRLEDQGVVTRERSTTDRRVVYVELTPDHQNKLKDLNENLDKHFEAILSKLPEQDIIRIFDSLNILKSAISNHLEHGSN